MALPIKRSLPSLSEITSPSVGLPKTLRTSLENTQSCPCKIRARGLTTIPAIEGIQRPIPHSPSQRFRASNRPTVNAQVSFRAFRLRSGQAPSRTERLGKPRHRREGRRLSERAVSESNLSFSHNPEMSPDLRIKLRLGRRLRSTRQNRKRVENWMLNIER